MTFSLSYRRRLKTGYSKALASGCRICRETRIWNPSVSFSGKISPAGSKLLS